MAKPATDALVLDMSATELREVNATLQGASGNETAFELVNPRGSHAMASISSLRARRSVSGGAKRPVFSAR